MAFKFDSPWLKEFLTASMSNLVDNKDYDFNLFAPIDYETATNHDMHFTLLKTKVETAVFNTITFGEHGAINMGYSKESSWRDALHSKSDAELHSCIARVAIDRHATSAQFFVSNLESGEKIYHVIYIDTGAIKKDSLDSMFINVYEFRDRKEAIDMFTNNMRDMSINFVSGRSFIEKLKNYESKSEFANMIRNVEHTHQICGSCAKYSQVMGASLSETMGRFLSDRGDHFNGPIDNVYSNF